MSGVTAQNSRKGVGRSPPTDLAHARRGARMRELVSWVIFVAVESFLALIPNAVLHSGRLAAGEAPCTESPVCSQRGDEIW